MSLADEGNESVSPRSFLPPTFSSAFLLLSPTYAQSSPRDMQVLKREWVSGSESDKHNIQPSNVFASTALDLCL